MSWWRDAVCYEIHPRSFADSDGDGTGDLRGAALRLPHVRRLGADAVWITPFYPSPLADGGYDIADHRAVAPDLGTLDDFDALASTAHALGLKVIVDLVPNHTSDAHPWFREALAAGPGPGRARGRYLFRAGRGRDGEEPPNDWRSAFGGPAWTRVPDGEWYLHLHAPEQPDLDWRDAEVRADFEDTLRFWLDHGVDGFRVDVAHALFKAAGLPDAGPGQHRDPARNHLMPYYDQEELHPLYRGWRALLDRHPAVPGAVAPEDRVLVAEAAVFEPARLARYIRQDEMQQAFNFAFLEAPWDAPALRGVVDGSLAATAAEGAPVTWVLSSHDAVRPPTRYGSLLRARSAALLMLALPGAAYLYQGEELGLPQAWVPDDRIRDPLWPRSGHRDRGRDGARVPVPWSGDRPPYGFSSAAPSETWLPQPDGWGALTAEAQQGDPGSTFALYRAALRLRRTRPAPGHGSLVWHSQARASYLAFERAGLACVVNLGPDPLPLERTGLRGRPVLTSAEGDGTVPAAREALAPDTALWLLTDDMEGDGRAPH
ncbi:glycoside hydrolase family 13 protein [Streptomyces fuscigenes]|uniref:glycoside hydrolase family 13 protein n=1 Tax=Streptomyces fuscigenes TaxID=1528880 RepID=UPI001F23E8C4|nr:glycoside hydrolase family 13 protein [Streptomyces fuscigenes]MCF3960837.1 glycoside hydrolase family 13 protein [Streptomyces fuscigenes]